MRRLLGLTVVGLATLAPTWAHADDEQIAQTILERLSDQKAEGKLKGFGIDLEVENGTVMLKGHVANPEQEDLALDIARRVPGVEKVVNDLEVKQSGGSPATPKVSATPIAAEPIATPEKVATAVPMSAPKAAKPSLLTRLTSGINRVKQSSNRNSEPKSGSLQPMEITPISHDEPVPMAAAASPKSDANQIVQAIAAKLQAEKQAGTLRGFNVDLQCEEGTVWVSGHVSNQDQHSRVIDIARRIPGVKQVVNDLSVEAPQATRVETASAAEPSAAPLGAGVASSRANQTPRVSAAPYAPQQPIAHPNYAQMQPMQMTAVPVQLIPIQQQQYANNRQTPLAFATANMQGQPMPIAHQGNSPIPMNAGPGAGIAPARFDHPNLPGYAWPSYASHPNYAAVTYPKQYSPSAWPYIGPFYPYPQVPLGWRKVMLEWDDGWWYLDFKDK